MESSVVLEACTGSGSGSSSDSQVEQVDDQGIDSGADDEADDQLVVVDGAKVGVVLDPALQYVLCFDFLNRIGSQANGSTQSSGAEHVSSLGNGVHFRKDKAHPQIKATFATLRRARVPMAPP